MATENKRMQQRRRTAAQWASENPVLASGEIGVAIDLVPDFKIGDGSTAWNSLEGFPELTTSDTTKVPVSTSGGVTTLDVDDLAWAPLVARLSSDSSAVNNSTTLVDVTGLAVTLSTNAEYWVEGLLIYNSSTAADIKFSWTIPSGATGSWGVFGAQTGTAGVLASINTAQAAWTGNGACGGAGVGTQMVAMPRGVIVTAGTGGSFQLRFAQNSADATNTVVNAFSAIRADRVA